MSEEQKNTDLPVVVSEKENDEKLPTEEKKVFSRRQALLGALFGAGAVLAKTAEAAEASCACLAPPDCDSICANGGTPRGDGTQACDCNAEAKETLAKVAYTGKYSDLVDEPTLATVAKTGSYDDLTNKPTLTLSNVTTAGWTGPSADVSGSLPSYGSCGGSSIFSIQIPYIYVNAQGLVTSRTTKTLRLTQHPNCCDCNDMNQENNNENFSSS